METIGWKLLTTPPGARVQLLNPPGSEVGLGQVATWGKATANEVDAYGFQWNWASQSSRKRNKKVAIEHDFEGAWERIVLWH